MAGEEPAERFRLGLGYDELDDGGGVQVDHGGSEPIVAVGEERIARLGRRFTPRCRHVEKVSHRHACASLRNEPLKRRLAAREGDEQGHRPAPVGDLESFAAIQAPQVHAQVLPQCADAHSGGGGNCPRHLDAHRSTWAGCTHRLLGVTERYRFPARRRECGARWGAGPPFLRDRRTVSPPASFLVRLASGARQGRRSCGACRVDAERGRTFRTSGSLWTERWIVDRRSVRAGARCRCARWRSSPLGRRASGPARCRSGRPRGRNARAASRPGRCRGATPR